MAEPPNDLKGLRTRFLPEQVASDVFIAPGAVVVGDVTMASGVSVWFNAVLRADTESISIGQGSNIQDGAVCHADPGFPLRIGAGVTVGHNAIVHGAVIGGGCLIGMGAIVMNGAVIGSGCIVGAGALVTQKKTFPQKTLILGNPAKAIRAVTESELRMIGRSAREYEKKAGAFMPQER